MKSKNIIVAFLLISTLVSCNSDNESGIEPQPVTTVLVKNIKHTYTPNDIEISTLKYDGNKIISRSTDGGFIATYTYTGNVITKIEVVGCVSVLLSLSVLQDAKVLINKNAAMMFFDFIYFSF